MTIRQRIALGFGLGTVLVTGMITWWGATTLGFNLETGDLARFERAEAELLDDWAGQRLALASTAVTVARALALIDPGGPEAEEALRICESLRRHLDLEWIEVLRDGVPILHEGLRFAPGAGEASWPMRLATLGPLAHHANLAVSAPMAGRDRVLLAKRPRPVPITRVGFVVWDERGRLLQQGLEGDVPLRRLSIGSVPGQFFHDGRLWRGRTRLLSVNGPFLLLALEAEAQALTRTGVNRLMAQLAGIQILVVATLVAFLSRTIFRPLETLRAGLAEVARGHWHELALEGPDEVGQLAASFNHMVRELRLAQERLLSVQRALINQERLAVLGRFSAGLAHEINNPLGTILANAEMAMDCVRRSQPVELDDLRAIVEETERCRQIVATLLQYARNRPPDLTPVRIDAMIRDVVDELRRQPWLGTIVPELREPLPAVVVGADPLSIRQVVFNLVRNACEALAGHPHPRVTIAVADRRTGQRDADAATTGTLPTPSGRPPLGEEGEAMVVTVTDNGPGPTTPDDLFAPLHSTKHAGAGLGLAISQSIVEAHRGRMWYDRTADGLTRFHFTLVRAPAPIELPGPTDRAGDGIGSAGTGGATGVAAGGGPASGAPGGDSGMSGPTGSRDPTGSGGGSSGATRTPPGSDASPGSRS